MDGPRVLLIGLMATGKTTVGRLLATRLSAPYLDNDELVRLATGTALEELRLRQGEAGLRIAETQALIAALELPAPAVAGVAAGVVLDPENRSRLAATDATVVWLRALPETLARRVGSGGDRPWLRPDPQAVFERMMQERKAAYEQISDLIVDVDERTPAEIVDVIVDYLESKSEFKSESKSVDRTRQVPGEDE
jgi:shikimate kinase